MKSGRCPKCGHSTVYSGRNVPAKGSANNRLPIDFQNSVPLDNYVCTTCGYIERYVSDTEGLKRIREQWANAEKSKRKRE
ncbi:MAG: zinc ribbon domain-containing protein [Chloroflexota bacterium]